MCTKIQCADTEMHTGYVFSGKKQSELSKHIINKFAEENLKMDEAIIVLDHVRAIIGEMAVIQKLD